MLLLDTGSRIWLLAGSRGSRGHPKNGFCDSRWWPVRIHKDAIRPLQRPGNLSKAHERSLQRCSVQECHRFSGRRINV